MDTSESFLTANGLRHHVLTWDGGGAQTIVLCHGFLDMAASFDPLASRLAARGHRVVAFDFRGHGETEWIGAGGYYHFADYVLDLDELLPQLSSSPPHLVGHSMGGGVAMIYAGTRSERLASVTVIEGLGMPAMDPGKACERTRAWLDQVAKVRSRVPRPLASVEAALARMRIMTPELPDELGLFLAERGTRPAEGGEGRLFRFDPLHRTPSPMPFWREAFLSYAREIRVPLLLVVAEKGYRLPDEDERRRALPPHAFVEVPGVGHMLHWLAPDALADAIHAHVLGNPARP